MVETGIAILLWTAFTLIVACGLALDLVGLFGNWLILGAVATVWLIPGFNHFGLWSVLALFAIAVLGEVLETVLAGYGARRFGGSKGASLAALVGCIGGAIVGTPWLPIIGTLLGACAGAFVAAALYEYIQMEKKAGEAAWTGFGATLGKLGGLFAKFLCGLTMLLVAALTL